MKRASVVVLFALNSLAGNGADSAQREAEEGYLPKLNLLCGLQLSVRYDAESLAKHNQDIRYDQTGGSNECNEPLRYLWYVCKSAEGRALAQAVKVSGVVCRGTASAAGSLSFAKGIFTVERAFEEKKAWARSRAQFEVALKTTLVLGSEDPYYDEAWNDLRREPNPVTDTKTYCLVNGEKVKWQEYAWDSLARRKQDGAVKCWKDGELVTSLELKLGRKTGFSTGTRGAVVTRSAWLDDKEDGEQRTTESGRTKRVSVFARGVEQWSSEFEGDGALARHSRKYSDHLDEVALAKGQVISLSCSPQAGDDKDLRGFCGFDGELTTPIYDGTGKVARVVTWKDGVLQREAPGTSAYASRREVNYRDGKKQGEERIVDTDGTLKATISWAAGVKHGREVEYSPDGRRVVERRWKEGELLQRTDFFLNGNPKLREVFDTPRVMVRQRFWDTGKVLEEGTLSQCARRWCEEGVHKSFFENGAREAETTWKDGARQGAAKSWWPNGKLSEVVEFVDDRPTKRTTWDEKGVQLVDEEYEADGSRKLK